MRETWVESLGLKDPLEEAMATHSSTLGWRIPMDRGGWQGAVYGFAESDTTEQLSAQHRRVCTSTFLSFSQHASTGDMVSIPGSGRSHRPQSN